MNDEQRSYVFSLAVLFYFLAGFALVTAFPDLTVFLFLILGVLVNLVVAFWPEKR